MESFLATSAVLTIVAAGLVLIIRRNLRQRATARKFRQIFIATADDLVGKAEFPDAHARHLVSMAAIPQGWLTRFMVLQMVRRMAFGESEKVDLNEMRVSAGVGLSWISPMGPLRFSYAIPVRRKTLDRIEKLQFQIGTSF